MKFILKKKQKSFKLLVNHVHEYLNQMFLVYAILRHDVFVHLNVFVAMRFFVVVRKRDLVANHDHVVDPNKRDIFINFIR